MMQRAYAAPDPAWHEVVLPPADLFAGRHRTMHRRAFSAYREAGEPRRVALFATPVQRGRGVKVYFSPEASVLLRALVDEHRGRPCAPPEPQEVDLMIGHPYAGIWLLDWL